MTQNQTIKQLTSRANKLSAELLKKFPGRRNHKRNAILTEIAKSENISIVTFKNYLGFNTETKTPPRIKSPSIAENLFTKLDEVLKTY